ncbi:MAG TPA: hypothetical protein VFH88_05830 [Candidatus Krumholzibacteria bacterium]|nr:hypothetical protein [Candidatus Krumholzibacteria bacterium]
MTRMQELALQRAALVARSDRNRTEVAGLFGDIRHRLAIAETVVDVARRVRRNRSLVGAITVFTLLAPITARAWLRRAVWMVPLIVEGIRLARGRHAD